MEIVDLEGPAYKSLLVRVSRALADETSRIRSQHQGSDSVSRLEVGIVYLMHLALQASPYGANRVRLAASDLHELYNFLETEQEATGAAVELRAAPARMGDAVGSDR